MQHSFDILIATKYGVNEAIILNNFAFWLAHNKANNKHFHENRHWTYNSVRAFLELFPYWTTKNLRTIIDSCIKQGLIIKGNFNKHSYDKTGWYTLTDQALALFPALSICPNRQMSNDEACEGEKALETASDPICPNRQMDMPETANGYAGNGKPIPDINTDNKPDNKSSCTPAQKKTNKQKHEWAETKKPLASVEKQSNSYNAERLSKIEPVNKLLAHWAKQKGIAL